jgi:hypothetical protein
MGVSLVDGDAMTRGKVMGAPSSDYALPRVFM